MARDVGPCRYERVYARVRIHVDLASILSLDRSGQFQEVRLVADGRKRTGFTSNFDIKHRPRAEPFIPSSKSGAAQT
jgi:hypothetical protein